MVAAAVQAVGRGWRDVGRPVTLACCKLFFSARLDLALAIGFNSVAPGGLGVALSRGVRLIVAARVARSQGLSLPGGRQMGGRRRRGGDGSDSEDEGEEGDEDPDAAPGSTANGSGQANGSSSSGHAAPPAGPAGRPARPAPKGLGGGLPPLPLPRIPPGGLACCSTQPVGLPMLFLGGAAARAPMYAAARGDRLVRGLIGLASSFLICRVIRTPFTGRLARLPPRFVEYLFGSVVGPAAAVSYLSASGAGQGTGRLDSMLCEHFTPTLRQLYNQLRGAGQEAATRGGRPVVFSSKEATVEAIPRSDINACCLPGGIVFVHSALLKAVNGRKDSIAFVLGHEVGHAIGRHSLEKATSTYQGMFAIDCVVGLAERALRSLVGPGPDREEWVAARLKTVDGLLQSGLYVLQLGQSRRHEYEADQMALALGAGAGMNRSALFSGARDVLTKFMKMEAAQPGGLPAPASGAPQSDSPLSTHPAAVNRLRRLSEVAALSA